MLDFLPPREASILSVDALKSEEKYDQEEVDRSNGNITGIVSFSFPSRIHGILHPEAPSPANIRRKYASENGPKADGDTERAGNDAKEKRPSFSGNR